MAQRSVDCDRGNAQHRSDYHEKYPLEEIAGESESREEPGADEESERPREVEADLLARRPRVEVRRGQHYAREQKSEVDCDWDRTSQTIAREDRDDEDRRQREFRELPIDERVRHPPDDLGANDVCPDERHTFRPSARERPHKPDR